jgi:hypothetical protein
MMYLEELLKLREADGIDVSGVSSCDPWRSPECE